MAIQITSDKFSLDPDASRLWDKYCLCRKPSYEEYDKMNYKERERMKLIDRAVESKKRRLMELAGSR